MDYRPPGKGRGEPGAIGFSCLLDLPETRGAPGNAENRGFMQRWIRLFAAVAAFAAAIAARNQAQAAPTVTLVLDASSAARGIMYVHETVPVTPGRFTLVYPKWIPGEHGPTGPLNDLAAIRISAAGKALDWRRDDVDMYAFHVKVPPGVQTIDVEFRRSHERAARRDVDAIAGDRQLESRATVSRRREFARLSNQTVDRAAAGLAVRDRAPRSGAKRKSRRLRPYVPGDARGFAARSRAVR